MHKWNIQYLDELYKKYSLMAQKESDPTKSLEYESTAGSIWEIIERYDELTTDKKIWLPNIAPINFREVISSDFSLIKKYGYYCPYIRALNEFNEMLDVTPKQRLTRVNFNSAKVITVSSSFFSQFKGTFSETYSEIASNFRNTIHFHRLNKNITNSGQTYSVYNTPLSFFELGVNSTVQDYISTIHEFGHGISCALNPTAMWDYEKYCFIEVDSLFFELLGTDYVGKKTKRVRDCFNVNVQVLKDYLYSAQLICSKLDMYSTLSKSELTKKKKLIEYLAETEHYNKLGIKDTLNTYIREYFHYIISYLTAIELYFIYYEAPEVALDLLLKIITNKKDSNTEYLNFVKSLGLEPGKNFEKYVEGLINKAKELKDEKSLRYKN